MTSSIQTKMTIGAFALLASTTTNPVLASGMPELKPYVGLDYQLIHVDFQTENGVDYGGIYEDGYHSANPHLGVRLGEHFGVEVGYTKSTSESRTFDGALVGLTGFSGTTETEFTGFNIDLLGFYALPDIPEVEFVGTVGLARWKADTSLKETTGAIPGVLRDKVSDTILRAGAGVQYAFTEHWSARTMVRYIDADFNDTVSNGWSVSAGLNYTF